MRWALVTGAARGIGRAVARRLLVEGYGVLAVDRDREMLARTLAELATDGTIEGEVADLADPGAIDALADRLRHRTDRLAALVNNAGINIRKPLEELAEAEWARVLAVNLTAPFLLVRAL
ncbi:MAG TPA: SDR family NAD(P)-dependent oxidoreductase, partial [Rhodospirillales bacterium]|nr:SDR family NAD(P)-dependent oxidoreductase [Rhodospirillales bacterium]